MSSTFNILDAARAAFAEEVVIKIAQQEQEERKRRQKAQDALVTALNRLTNPLMFEGQPVAEQPVDGVLYVGPVALVAESTLGYDYALHAYARFRRTGYLYSVVVASLADLGRLLTSLRDADEQGTLPDSLFCMGRWNEGIPFLKKRLPLPEDAGRAFHITDPLPPCPQCNGRGRLDFDQLPEAEQKAGGAASDTCPHCDGRQFDPECGYKLISAVATHVTVYAPGVPEVRCPVDDPDADRWEPSDGSAKADSWGMEGRP